MCAQSITNSSARTGAGTTLPSTGSPDLPGLVACSGAMGNQVIADRTITVFPEIPVSVTLIAINLQHITRLHQTP